MIPSYNCPDENEARIRSGKERELCRHLIWLPLLSLGVGIGGLLRHPLDYIQCIACGGLMLLKLVRIVRLLK